MTSEALKQAPVEQQINPLNDVDKARQELSTMFGQEIFDNNFLDELSDDLIDEQEKQKNIDLIKSILLYSKTPEGYQEILDNLKSGKLDKSKASKLGINNKEVREVEEDKQREVTEVREVEEDKQRKVTEVRKEDKKATQVDEKATQVDKNIDIVKRRAEVLAMGQKLSSEMNLEGLSGYEDLKKEAKEKVIAQNPELENNPEALEKHATAYILANKQEALFKLDPGLQQKFGTQLAEFSRQAIDSGLFKGINGTENAKNIDIAFKNTPGILKRDVEFAKASITATGGLAEISGNTITNGDQIVRLSEKGAPEKVISRYGYEISTKQDFPTKYPYEAKKAELKEKYSQLLKKLPENDLVSLSQNPNNLQTLTQNAKNDLTQKQQNLTQKQQELFDIKSQIPSDDNIKKETELYEAISILEKQINDLQEKIKVLEQLTQVQQQAKDIETQEQKRLPDFVSNQERADETARDTLNFLDTLGLTNISQSNLETILKRVNSNQNALGLSKQVDLETGFKSNGGDVNKFKREFVNILLPIYKQMGIDVNVESLVAGRKNPQITYKTNFTQSLEKVGINQGVLNIETFMSALKSKNEK